MKEELDILLALAKYMKATGNKPQGIDPLIDQSIGTRMVYKLEKLEPTPEQWRMVVWGLPYDALKNGDEDLTKYRSSEASGSEKADKEDSTDDLIDWGFDLTDFNEGDFEKLLKMLGVKPKAEKSEDGWRWKGKDIIIVTANNPLNGEYYRSGLRANELNYASYIGMTGKEDKINKAVSFIKKYANYKDESPNSRDFI